MSNLTFFEAQKWAFSFVEKHDGERSAIELLLKGLRGWSSVELLCHYSKQLTPAELVQFKKWVKCYNDGWPVQYLLGKASFFGHEFKVNENTLIPRPETAELVEWVLADYPAQIQQLRVADIGTGTGAIGISLQKERPAWEVTLTDISPAALRVAQVNAARLKAHVRLLEGDLFAPLTGQYQVIVSNPPYIAVNEQRFMDKSVLEHEPNAALFASENGLHFYHRIAAEIKPFISAETCLYLEIGFQQGMAVKKIFNERFPTASVTVKRDLAGNERMVKVEFNIRRDESNADY